MYFGLCYCHVVDLDPKERYRSHGYAQRTLNPFSGELIAKVQVKISSEYTDFLSPLKAITGEHAVYFVFHPEGKTLGDFSHFAFV